MMEVSRLTTVDNPYDPFSQWDEWYVYDTMHGYNTCSLLALLTYTSDELSEADQNLSIENAIDEIVRENVCGMWRKVTRNFPDRD